jgi:hypothetical protein
MAGANSFLAIFQFSIYLSSIVPMSIRRWVGRPSSPRRTVFYLHLPKTGGTTVARALTRNRRISLLVSEKVDTKQQVLDRLQSLPSKTLQKIQYVAGHRVFSELQHLFPSKPVFATSVRHPVDLYISLYNFWVDLALDHTHKHYLRNREMMLRDSIPVHLLEWLESRDEWLNMYARVFSRAETGPEAPGIPLTDVTQHSIDYAKTFLGRCDFILELNHSHIDIPRFCDYCGISPPRARSRVSTKHAATARGSTSWDEARAIIRKRSESDFELYAYALECRKIALNKNLA